MNLIDAQNTFALRLYEWSQRDFYRELEADCPVLSLVGLNWRRTAALVAWNKILNSSQRLQLSKSLTLLFHNNARRLRGETAIENDFWWKREEARQTSHYMEILPPLLISDENSLTFEPANPDRCLDNIILVLSPGVFGKAVRQRSAVRCIRKINDWKLVTQFTFEKRARRLDCTFQFIRKDDKARYPIPEDGRGPYPRNLFTFYGIYNHTLVIVESKLECETMPKVMAKLAEHFVAQAEPLFTGLGIND